MIDLRNTTIFLFTLCALIWFLFQKKMLSKSISEIVSKIFFYPTFPITAMLRLGNYWTAIDETVFYLILSPNSFFHSFFYISIFL